MVGYVTGRGEKGFGDVGGEQGRSEGRYMQAGIRVIFHFVTYMTNS